LDEWSRVYPKRSAYFDFGLSCRDDALIAYSKMLGTLFGLSTSLPDASR